MMKFGSMIGLAFEAITRNKLRSALTSLGVIMGVAAVIVMMALGDGAKASIEQRVASLGTNVITVSAGSANSAASAWAGRRDDADAGGCRGDRHGGSRRPRSLARRQHARADRRPVGQLADPGQGAGSAFADIRAWTVSSGGFFTEDDVERAARVVVIGTVVRDQMFGEGANPIGAIVRINNQPFRVMGVLERKGQSAMGQDQDDTMSRLTPRCRSGCWGRRTCRTFSWPRRRDVDRAIVGTFRRTCCGFDIRFAFGDQRTISPIARRKRWRGCRRRPPTRWRTCWPAWPRSR